jgi:hypothetical protein
MNKLKMLPASYYKAIFNNKLSFTGHRDNGLLKMDIEQGKPVLIGNNVDMMNFFDEVNND